MIDDFQSNSLLANRAKSAAYFSRPNNYEKLVTRSKNNMYNNDDEYYSPTARIFDSDSVRNSKSEYANVNNANVYDIVKSKNSNARIDELERTNLKLRRMIQYASIDRLPQRPETARLMEHDSNVKFNLLGPPVLRQGRIGSSWRHIKQTNNYSNSNFLFIDGTVRIDDSKRYPPRMYGYPPKTLKSATTPRLIQTDRQDYHERSNNRIDMCGLESNSLAQLSDLPINNIVKNRPLNLNSYDNKYQLRAKEGFEYWNKDKRYPENNKPKAKMYTTGAYKTFFGLSDSNLKT